MMPASRAVRNLMTAFLAVAPGMAMAETPPPVKGLPSIARIFNDMLELLHKNYINPHIDDEQLLKSALHEILSFTAFQGPDLKGLSSEKRDKRLRQRMQTNMPKVGAEIDRVREAMHEKGIDDPGQIVEAAVRALEKTHAGLQARERAMIVSALDEMLGKLDSHSSLRDSAPKARKKIKTAPEVNAPKVKLKTRQKADNAASSLLPDTAKPLVHDYVLNDGNGQDLGYIKIDNFTSDDVGENTMAAFDDINKKTGGHAGGYILDLRKNPGGFVAESLKVAASVMTSGELMSTHGRNPGDVVRISVQNDVITYSGSDPVLYSISPISAYNHFKQRRGDIAEGKPIVVLIDGETASAAEIVAAALKRRATIMGERSFGKGSIQLVEDYKDIPSTKVRYTAALYTAGSGYIQAKGVSPHIVAAMPGAVEPQREADGKHIIANPDGPATVADAPHGQCVLKSTFDARAVGQSFLSSDGNLMLQVDVPALCAVAHLHGGQSDFVTFRP